MFLGLPVEPINTFGTPCGAHKYLGVVRFYLVMVERWKQWVFVLIILNKISREGASARGVQCVGMGQFL